MLVAAEATAMGTFLAMIGEAATWVMNQATTIGQTIVSIPVLAIALVVPILGGAVGLFTRLLRH